MDSRFWTVQNVIDSKDQMRFKVPLTVEPQLRDGELYKYKRKGEIKSD